MFVDSDGKVYDFDYTFAPYVGTSFPRTPSTYSYRYPKHPRFSPLHGTLGDLGRIPTQLALKAIYLRLTLSAVTGNLRTAMFNSIALIDTQWDTLTKTQWGVNHIKYRLNQIWKKLPIGEQLTFQQLTNTLNANLLNALLFGVPGVVVGGKEKVEKTVDEIKDALKKAAELAKTEKEDFMKVLLPIIVGSSILGMGLVLIPMFTKKKKKRGG